jgi:demethylmenaquinone methyltransferase/2-methoxy-6-polyprenyl-1,4-benzoquinol methylase
MSKETTHFGFKDVPVEHKQALVGEVFTSVASRYDVMNDLMSLGLHRLWKRYFVSTARVRPGQKVLDLAGGTGDIAGLIAPLVGTKGMVVLSDINVEMLRRGRDRMLDEGHSARVSCAQINAQALPFPRASFDLVTIAFGLRNVTDQRQALKEIFRVLKPGGRALVLEFSEVRQPLLKPVYDAYSFTVLPRLGKLVAKDEGSYRYLAESIRKHPNQEALAALMQGAGFERVDHRNLLGGIVAIHSGYAL